MYRMLMLTMVSKSDAFSQSDKKGSRGKKEFFIIDQLSSVPLTFSRKVDEEKTSRDVAKNESARGGRECI